jgi:hypothetical protein
MVVGEILPSGSCRIPSLKREGEEMLRQAQHDKREESDASAGW